MEGSCCESPYGLRLFEYRPLLEAGRRTTTDGGCCSCPVGRGLRLLGHPPQHPSRPPHHPHPPTLSPPSPTPIPTPPPRIPPLPPLPIPSPPPSPSPSPPFLSHSLPCPWERRVRSTRTLATSWTRTTPSRVPPPAGGGKCVRAGRTPACPRLSLSFCLLLSLSLAERRAFRARYRRQGGPPPPPPPSPLPTHPSPHSALPSPYLLPPLPNPRVSS